jgi:uncharacterized Fe-S cluster-containing radical SAM superfamily enzyme
MGLEYKNYRYIGITDSEIRHLLPTNAGAHNPSDVPFSTPAEIYIDTCSKCNPAYSFCPTNMVSEGKEERNRIMPFNMFRKIVDDMKQFDTTVESVILQQFGEPLLNPHIPEMIAYLKKSNVCRTVFMVTNGLLLNPKLNRALIDAGIDVLRVSVNGLDAEAYRNICGVNVDYDEFVANIADFFKKSGGGGPFWKRKSRLHR